LELGTNTQNCKTLPDSFTSDNHSEKKLKTETELRGLEKQCVNDNDMKCAILICCDKLVQYFNNQPKQEKTDGTKMLYRAQ
jgi:hypothetical protein